MLIVWNIGVIGFLYFDNLVKELMCIYELELLSNI